MGLLNPAWSPDGSRIAFTVVDSSSHGQIAVIDRDGAHYHVLTRFDSTEGMPQCREAAPRSGVHLNRDRRS